MKFNFKIQKYQSQAVDSIVSCFAGQPFANAHRYCRDKGLLKDNQGLYQPSFTNNGFTSEEEELEESDIGYSNAKLVLKDKELLENINKVQDQNFITRSASIARTAGRPSFDIEMETGTGKTYVYTKTMYELHKVYGWNKFIIVVPSVAIREGIYKSLEYTQDHFMEHYGKKIRFFIYNSNRLNMIDQYSSSADINAMIINTQAFNTSLKEDGKSKEARIIFTKRDNFASRRPIDVIAANHPILILDEPQRMGKKDQAATQQALEYFKPLFVLNFSATHVIKHNLVYRLDALDAYNQKLVKKIEVKGFKLENIAGTNTYIYADSIILSPNAAPQVKLEIEVKQKSGIKRITKKLSQGDKLETAAEGLAEYAGIYIAEILPEQNAVRFNVPVSSNPDPTVMYMGEVTGNVAEKDIRRVQIRETIRSHFAKERDFFDKGLKIKVLSLFFIDEVAKYREYDENGQALIGEYGRMFEEEYCNILKEFSDIDPDSYYQKFLVSTAQNIGSTHEGYFSIDNKTGRYINTKESKDGNSKEEDVSVYDMILKRKDLLLDFDMPIRFIFSHSALREGWDNPNVFQICTLKHSDNTVSRRQEVGRGMRLCVNEDGVRQDKETIGSAIHDVNTLTVIASESYKDFVAGLQKDISAELSDSRPKIADEAYFIGKDITICGQHLKINEEQASVIYQYLARNSYIDRKKLLTDIYKDAVEFGNIQSFGDDLVETLPEGLKTPVAKEEMFWQVQKLIQAVYNPSVLSGMIDNAQRPKWEKGNPLNKNFDKEIFQELWNKINHKYSYTCHFNSDELIANVVTAIKSELKIAPMRYTLETGSQKNVFAENEVRSGTSFGQSKTETKSLSRAVSSKVKYDLVGDIAKGCKLTRKTVATILSQLTNKEKEQFGFNPEKFIRDVINIINAQKSTKIVEHIEYHELEDRYDQSIFTDSKLPDKKPFLSKKAIQDLIFTDGSGENSIEWKFATDLEAATEVVVYAKLPKSFQIPTPVGNYAPDWAIAFNKDKVQHVFFIAETKGSLDDMQLRKIESNKIECAKKLFNVVSTNHVKYDHVDNYAHLKDIVGLQ